MSGSLRLRLTLWNAVILAIALGGFGLALCLFTHWRASAAVDRMLQIRAQQFADGHAPPPPGQRPPPPPGGDPPPPPPGQDGQPAPEAAARQDGQPGPEGAARQDGQPGPEGAPRPAAGQWQPGDPRADGAPGGPPPAREDGPPGGGDAGLLNSINTATWGNTQEILHAAKLMRPRFFDMGAHSMQPSPFNISFDPTTVRSALGGTQQFTSSVLDGEPIRVLTVPRWDGPRIIGAVQVAMGVGEYDTLWKEQMFALLMLLPLSLLAAIGGAFLLTGRALQPVAQITHAAAQIGAEDLSRRLPVNGHDELATLAATFNGMIGRLQSAFERQRRFTADASHELRTPLTRIKVSTSQALGDQPSVAEYRKALTIADRAADAMEHLIEELLLLARIEAGAMKPNHSAIDLADVLRDAVGMVTGTSRTTIKVDIPAAPMHVRGDREQLQRVFINLLQNAVRHTPDTGTITVAARVMGDQVFARVVDTGEGISREHLPHLTERFYRVDAARNRRSGGSGLGLAICQEIVQAHSGSMDFESEPGRGTAVTITLPEAHHDRTAALPGGVGSLPRPRRSNGDASEAQGNARTLAFSERASEQSKISPAWSQHTSDLLDKVKVKK